MLRHGTDSDGIRRHSAGRRLCGGIEALTELAATLPTDLLDLYEKLRASSGGIGAAALHRGRCEGCHLQLNTTDLNNLRDAPPDDVVRCEECRRILVRTAESGL